MILDEIESLRERERSVLMGICTTDFSSLYDLSLILGKKGISYIITGPGEKVDAQLDCLMVQPGTAEPDLAHQPSSKVTMDKDPLVTIDRALTASWGLSRPSMLIIGIDPGLRPGVAYFLDGRLVAVYRASSPEDLLDNVVRRKRGFRARRSLVKVGNGDPERRDRIVRLLRGAGVRTMIVDERCTTRSRRQRDEHAAVQIAKVECDARSYNNGPPSRGSPVGQP